MDTNKKLDNENVNKERNALTPMTSVIEDIKDRGYTKEFMVKDGQLKEMGTHKTYKTDSLRLADEFRFEGTSDPEYMGILYAIESDNGDKGYVSSAYGGANADTEVHDFIKKIDSIHQKGEHTDKDISDRS